MAHKRQETGWQPPPAPDPEHERLAADMFPLLTEAEGEGVLGQGAMLSFMALALDSDDLIEEPEFSGVYANPLLCVEAFAQELAEQGLEEVDPEELDAAEQAEAYQGLMEGTVEQTLTPELQEAILSALRDLRERAQEEGKEALMVQAAAVYAFLDGMGSDEVWVNVGVVQAVIQRSLDAGLEMQGITLEATRRAAAGKGKPGLLRRLLGATPEQRMDTVLASYPGLAGYMTGQIESNWDEGVEALGFGQLDLGLFSEAETSAALEKARSLGIELKEGAQMLVADAESAEDKVQAFALWLISYVDELATPQRLARMQARLDDLAVEMTPSQLAFLAMLNEELQAGNASERLRPLLVRALLGEAQNAVGARAQVQG